MSFILDALKKSESERQRQAIPGLMDSRPVPARTRFPLWAVALIALLAVNLGVLAVVLTRGRTPSLTAATTTAPVTTPAAAMPPAPATSAAVPPATAPPAPSARDHFSPMDPTPADTAPVYAPEIPQEQGLKAASGVPHHAARAPDPVLTPDDDKSNDEVLPSINEINLSGPQALPELHLDVHVYATQPAERFVYINMRKYHEGATLAEGPVLERIRRDGVVLNYNGLRFLLPRQQ